MRLFTTIAGLRCYLDLHRRVYQPESTTLYEASPIGVIPDVGLVPTMGALHAGHLSLIQRARRENKIVVVSIFVNPLQFGPQEDFQQYPRTLSQDSQLCDDAGVDLVFAPSPAELGIGGDRAPAENPPRDRATPPATIVYPPPAMMSGLCGRSRSGHFEGVATIVIKLLNLVQPDRAYFGQKDAQQLAIIRQVVADLNLPVEIVSCPIVREPNGLAMSSRNQYLTPTQREQAAILYDGLRQAEQAFKAGERFSANLIDRVQTTLAAMSALMPEYIELVDLNTMTPIDCIEDSGLLAVAARLGGTRLIDNILLCDRKPIVAIDGPAGAGKSTVTRLVAEALGLLYLDTGAMYRAFTWLVLQSEVDLDDEPGVAELVSQCTITFGNQVDSTASIWINGQDVTQVIRTPEVTDNVSAIAAQPAVRKELVCQQQRYGQRGGIVIEGRDVGTYVFPDAEVKIFLTASVQERARRRQLDMKNQGMQVMSLEQLEQAIYERDRKDSTRSLAPLRKAGDAIELQTDGLSITEVVAQIVRLYERKISSPAA